MDSYIYMILDETRSCVKIGVSKHPEKRIKQLQTGSPNPLKLVQTFQMDKSKVYQIEKDCHREMRSVFRKRGEWFHNINLWQANSIIESVMMSHGVID